MTTIAQLQRTTETRDTIKSAPERIPSADWRSAVMAPVQRYAEHAEHMRSLHARLPRVQVHRVYDGARRNMPLMPLPGRCRVSWR
jgi:glutamate---cysteine ligase / carboxylate-amine ligase